jgi:transposase
VTQRTQLLNALRSHLAEIGIIAAQGPNNARALATIEGNDMIPAAVRSALLPLVRQLTELDDEIRQGDQAVLALAKADETARRLMTVPGVGPITASALVASVQDIPAFSGPRDFAAFLGLTPRQNSSGGKERLGRVSKMGNRQFAQAAPWSALMLSVPAMR